MFTMEGRGFDHIAVVPCVFSKHPLRRTSVFHEDKYSHSFALETFTDEPGRSQLAKDHTRTQLNGRIAPRQSTLSEGDS